jgi:YggT family protein
MLAQVSPVQRFICVALTVYWVILLAKVILSWLPMVGVRMPSSGPGRAAIDLIDGVTEPVLRPLRRVISPVRMGAVGLDLSVIILFIILIVAQMAICT